jgi:SDR family mycofactocin-dependent oxidoreductase
MGLLEGKVAFVTGAARGQGRSHAVRLAEQGANIIAADICQQLDVPYEGATTADLDETVRQVEALDRRILAAEADVRDFAALQSVVGAGVSAFGGVDIVVANAGICSFDTIEEMSVDKWQLMIDIDLTGVFKTVKAALPHLNDGGSIIITSSTAGLKGFASLGHYSAAKHGLVGFMRALAHEVGPRRIRVNTVHPTQVPTKMLMNEQTYRMFNPHLDEPTMEDFRNASEAGMVMPVPWVEPGDISDAILFLASDASKFITGVTLPVDAGAQMF